MTQPAAVRAAVFRSLGVKMITRALAAAGSGGSDGSDGSDPDEDDVGEPG